MVFSDEEKKVFKIDDNKPFNIEYCLEENLLGIYDVNDNEITSHNLSVTLNFMKRLVTELSNKKGYGVVGNECYDIDALLKDTIDVSDDSLLVGFDPLLYKSKEDLNNYFNVLTRDMSWDDLKNLASTFGWVNDGFRSFFASNFNDLINLSSKAYYELDSLEKSTSFSEFSVFNDVKEEKVEEVNNIETKDDEFEFGDWASGDEWLNELNTSTQEDTSSNVVLDKDTLIKYVKTINVIDEFIKYRKYGVDILNKLYDLVKQKKLDDFYNDETFTTMFNQIMEHDTNKSSYYFHGTQCLEDAETIIDEGLGMMREDLNTTSYREFTKDDVILYERGFAGEIGRDAIVIIDVPKNDNGEELSVVTPLQDASDIHFSPSGLQGLNGKPNYIILPENIKGYVDKRNKQVVFNPKYKNYEQIAINNMTR